jgi:hypothetical protein
MNILRWRGRQPVKPIQEVGEILSEIIEREFHQLVHDIFTDLLPISSIAYVSGKDFRGRTSYPYLRIWIKK